MFRYEVTLWHHIVCTHVFVYRSSMGYRVTKKCCWGRTLFGLLPGCKKKCAPNSLQVNAKIVAMRLFVQVWQNALSFLSWRVNARSLAQVAPQSHLISEHKKCVHTKWHHKVASYMKAPLGCRGPSIGQSVAILLHSFTLTLKCNENYEMNISITHISLLYLLMQGGQ